MQAISVENGQLILTEHPLPQPSAQQVLIQVVAAGVNRADIMQKRGYYPPPAGASSILGLEVAGRIVAIGSDVTQWRVGDAVCALVTGGGYAEYCLAEACCCLPKLPQHDFIQSAALPEALFTVWANVFELGQLQAGETLLVHGGSSGIGTMAIQLARAFQARVFVTVGSEEKRQACFALGAAVAINYREQDFVEIVQQSTQQQGVNLILDMIGADYLQRNIDCLAVEGRLVHIALQHGIHADINLLPLLNKRLTLTGSTLRARDSAFKALLAQRLQYRVLPLFSNYTLKPMVHSVFALAQAEQAHQLMLTSQHIGKIILRVCNEL